MLESFNKVLSAKLFVDFHQKNCIIFIFISFFDEASNFRNRILTNQTSEMMKRICLIKNLLLGPLIICSGKAQCI